MSDEYRNDEQWAANYVLTLPSKHLGSDVNYWEVNRLIEAAALAGIKEGRNRGYEDLADDLLE